MEAAEKFILEIYLESTPNPESQKFVTNKHLLPNFVLDFKNKEAVKDSELAEELFKIPFVSAVFISNNFVTITKKPEYEWYEISPEIKETLKNFIQSGRPVAAESVMKMGEAPTQDNAPENTESKIKDLLDKYVKPAVESDGGHIAFKSFENGIVSLSMQGSCSGCPSASATLKGGIEGLLKRMVPEVLEVVAVEE
jgi:Fe-S cluster biogenesis protein NfuA